MNNILEQDHRAIKRRVNAKQGFRKFLAAQRTTQGCEAINILRKGQVRCVRGNSTLPGFQYVADNPPQAIGAERVFHHND